MQYSMMDQIARSLSITFLHSLWQAFILLAVAHFTLIITANQSSANRYRLLVGYFVAFILSAGFTFITVLGETGSSQPVILEADIIPGSTWYNNSIGISFLQSITAWCINNAILITGVWAAFFVIKCFLFTRSLSCLHKLKKYDAPSVSPDWLKKLAELSVRVKMKKVIEFRESVKVNQPFVFGIFKPILFVPLGMLTQLPPAEVEAILLHELAHIKRQDLFVNFLQVCIGTIFFFNPFVYWLSGLIRLEREYCCDDVCLQKEGSKKALIRALISFHENPNFMINHSLPLAGKKSLLSGRVSRIINGKNLNVSWYGALLLPLSISVLSVVFLSFNKPGNISKAYTRIEVLQEKKMKDAALAAVTPVSLTKSARDTTRPKKKTTRTSIIPASQGKLPIPENASPEFIAGYHAAMNYAAGKMPSGEKADMEIKEITKNALQERNLKPGSETHRNIPKENLSKREIEMILAKKVAG